MATSHTCDLWYGLHDAFIRRIKTDGTAATAIVAVENFPLNEFYAFPNGSEFVIHFTGVQELSVLISRRCGVAMEHDGNAPRRFESASWTEFESGFSDERGPAEEGKYYDGRYEILDAHVSRKDEAVTFVADDIVDYAGFPAPDSEFLSELKIVATHIEVRSPDGVIRSLEDFATLAEAYWRQHRDAQ